MDDESTASGLPVELVLMDTRLGVRSAGETIGTYPLGETSVERIAGDRFRLEIGSETLIFVADDALGFSYDALPFIRSGGSHPTSTGLRRFAHRLLGGRRPGETSAEAPTPTPQPPEPLEPPVESPSVGGADLPESVVIRVDAPASRPSVIEPSPDEISAAPTSEVPSDETVRCAGAMSDGSPCPMQPGPESSLCHTHARRLEQRSAELHRRRDEAAAMGVGSSLPDLDEVLARLEKAVAQVHDGSLLPQQAQAMASLVQAMIETIELSSARREPNRT